MVTLFWQLDKSFGFCTAKLYCNFSICKYHQIIVYTNIANHLVLYMENFKVGKVGKFGKYEAIHQFFPTNYFSFFNYTCSSFINIIIPIYWLRLAHLPLFYPPQKFPMHGNQLANSNSINLLDASMLVVSLELGLD